MKEERSTGIVSQPIQTREGNDQRSIIQEATQRALDAYSYWKDNQERAAEDVSMIFGDQYDDEELGLRTEENRISMTFNKLPQFINRVTGAQRSSAQTIQISPTGASIGLKEPDIVTTDGDKIPLSDVLTGLIRDIEYQSNAISSYKTAFKQSLEGGFGWCRVLTKYQDDGFDLDADIKVINDRWSVLVDPNAKESDLSDMDYCFIYETMTLKEFNKRYPGKSHETLAGDASNQYTTFWGTEDTVTVTEYFRREPINKEIVLYSNGHVYDAEQVDDVKEQMLEQGIEEVKRRKVKSHKVVWCKLTQGDILEKEIEFPTSTIPVVPFLGRVTHTRNKILTKGLVHDAIDAQIAINKMKSSALERIDMSPLSPFIATDKAIEGYEQQWADANTVKFSTLVYRKGEERPQREPGSTMPIAELQVGQSLDEDMKSSIGIFNASLGQASNEISGRAIEARQTEADVGTYEFIDNYENAIRRIGLLLVEMIPRIYDTERIIRIRGTDDTEKLIEINKVVVADNGDEVVINDLDFGKHTVRVSTGASYETKQQENAAQILELMRVNPAVGEVGSDLLVRNLDFSESDVLADRLLKTIPPQLLSKEKREEVQKDQPQPQPSPQEQQMQMEMQLKQAELESKAQESKIKLEIEKIKLQVAQLNLETKRIESGIKIEDKQAYRQEKEEERREKIIEGMVDQMKKS